MKTEEMFQEIFVRLRFSPDVKIHERTFAWRLLNFNKLWLKNLSIDQEKGELSFTSEFNAKYSKSYIQNFIKEDSYFSIGEGISVKPFDVELIDIKEEHEIYLND